MLTRYLNSIVAVVAALALSFGARAQTAPSKQPEVTKSKSAAPAPRRDLSGIWDVEDRMEGIAPTGVKSHAPFTAWGADIANNLYKPGDGPRRVTIGLVNDPLDSCDPAGFPRNLLFELRPFQVVQTPNQVLMLYQYQRVWRVVWTDGRELPKDPDPQCNQWSAPGYYKVSSTFDSSGYTYRPQGFAFEVPRINAPMMPGDYGGGSGLGNSNSSPGPNPLPPGTPWPDMS